MITPYPDLRFFWWENPDWMDAHTVPEAAFFCLYHPRKHCITEHQLSGHNCITVPAFHLQESHSECYRSGGYKLMVSEAKSFLWHARSTLVCEKLFYSEAYADWNTGLFLPC